MPKQRPNTKESPHETYYISKGTKVQLKEDLDDPQPKEHIVTKNLTFTDKEFVEYKDGWYTFEKEGWQLRVQRKFVTKDNLRNIF